MPIDPLWFGIARSSRANRGAIFDEADVMGAFVVYSTQASCYWKGLSATVEGDRLNIAEKQATLLNRVMKRCLFLLVLLTNSLSAYEGEMTQWHGSDRYDFIVGDQKCILVAPQEAAPGRPWVWRARFFGHEPQADIALLSKGYHLAYCDVGALFGNAEAVAHWDKFYVHVVGKYDLARKVALEGMSRGGLIIYNWAAKNPDKVACLYGDAPVCDLRSWPGGKWKGKGSSGDWTQAMAAHGLDEESASIYKGSPIDQLAPLAKAGIPLLHVVGEADVVVPVEENSDVIEKRYRELGGSIEVIRKPGVGHHPHALEDPKSIVDFIHRHTSKALSVRAHSPRVLVRSGLARSSSKFRQEKVGHVAFIGGSITEMNGYRPMVGDLLEERFPETAFTFTAAGISSTCSTTGAFRLDADVLSKGMVDLLFVEFAVNDDQDGKHAERECIRGLEGVVRNAYRANPDMDIVVTYFVNPPILKALQAAKPAVSIAAHDQVTKHYQIPTIHLAGEIADRISDKRLTWKQFGGTHPAPYGNRLCADLIEQLLESTRVEGKARALPGPLDPRSYAHGYFIDMKAVKGGSLTIPEWKALQGNCRTRFRDVSLLSLAASDEPLSLEFTGRAVGAYVLAGPDAGVAEFSIDGGAWKSVPLYHRHSKGLHYPRTVMFAADLKSGEHHLKLRVSTDPEHGGDAMRVLHFVANK
ncbi:MAG: GDSL-type esterase/lipase family protein [Verrucomicrobiales bacterium]